MGIHHIGLATRDAEKTRSFYEGVLEFPVRADDYIEIAEGGRIRHIMFDFGGGSLIAFMEAQDVEGIPTEFDSGINKGLGLPSGFYHFAFDAGSEEGLLAKRAMLESKGVQVSPVMTYTWAKSIYFGDPNGLVLEYSTFTRPLTPEDAELKTRYRETAAQLVYGSLEQSQGHEQVE